MPEIDIDLSDGGHILNERMGGSPSQSRRMNQQIHPSFRLHPHATTAQQQPPMTMKPSSSSSAHIPKYFLLSFLLFTPLLLLLSLRTRPTTVVVTTHDDDSTFIPPDIKIRPGYASYDAYIQRQLNKTLNPKLRRIWRTRDWERKIPVFSSFFLRLQEDLLLSNSSKSLCIGARVGQEVEALRRIGVSDSVGIDLVPYPPLVVKGDFHSQPFPDDTFDFEFSNVFDHALYPARFAGEIERTLRPGGVCVLHVAIDKKADKYSANDLLSVKGLVELFRRSEVVRVRKIDGFGLDTEVVFRKKSRQRKFSLWR